MFKIENIKDMLKFKQVFRLAIYKGLEAYSANSFRIDNSVVCKMDWGSLWCILVKPVPVGYYVASGTCINNLVSFCM